MKSDKYEIEYVYKNNGVSYKELMGKILQSEVILNGALKQKNLKMKVVSSCQKRKGSAWYVWLTAITIILFTM